MICDCKYIYSRKICIIRKKFFNLIIQYTNQNIHGTGNVHNALAIRGLYSYPKKNIFLKVFLDNIYRKNLFIADIARIIFTFGITIYLNNNSKILYN